MKTILLMVYQFQCRGWNKIFYLSIYGNPHLLNKRYLYGLVHKNNHLSKEDYFNLKFVILNGTMIWSQSKWGQKYIIPTSTRMEIFSPSCLCVLLPLNILYYRFKGWSVTQIAITVPNQILGSNFWIIDRNLTKLPKNGWGNTHL